MKYRTEAVDWALQQVDKSLDYDQHYGAQCVDLIRYYIRFLGCSQPAGVSGAKQLAAVEWNANQFDRIPRDGRPEPGDIAVFDGTINNKYGHVSIVISVAEDTFVSVDQNYINSSPNGAPSKRVEHKIDKRILCYYRPKFTPNPAEQGGTNKLKIQKGDTFWALERGYGWPVGTLQSLNRGVDPRKLAVGQEIIVPKAMPVADPPQPTPTPKYHTVVNGENLSVIAAKYGIVSWDKLYNMFDNRAIIGGNPNVIKPGMRLRVA